MEATDESRGVRAGHCRTTGLPQASRHIQRERLSELGRKLHGVSPLS